MNKFKLFIAASALIGTAANAQLIDEKDVSITLDLQPVLQLEMTTPDQIEFVFDEINEYQAGITQYAATILKVSSTVSWDLYAVGRSQGNTGNGFWDEQISYAGGASTPNRVNQLPLSLLELKQNQQNTALGAEDYFTPFNPASVGNAVASTNSIFYNADNSATAPTGAGGRYIAGTKGTAAGESMPGGSYLNYNNAPGATNLGAYYFTIDYRILPGLPATFPMATAQNGDKDDLATVVGDDAYASPGVYTMYVQYVLLEDQ